MAKYCSKCGETKDTTEFSVNNSKKDGLQSYCKVCNSKSNQIFREKNPLYMIDPNNGWFERNRDKWNEYIRGFWQSTKGIQTIYKITAPDGFVYVGSTGYDNPKNRFIIHHYDWYSPSRRAAHSIPLLHESFDIHGWDAHTIQYIEQFKGVRDEGYARENYWIKYYKDLGISLNKNGGK